MRRSGGIASSIATLAVLGVATAPAAAAPGDAERLGLQTVPKREPGKSASAISGPRGANPFLALLRNPAASDYAYWRAAMKQTAAKRTAKQRRRSRSSRCSSTSPSLTASAAATTRRERAADPGLRVRRRQSGRRRGSSARLRRAWPSRRSTPPRRTTARSRWRARPG